MFKHVLVSILFEYIIFPFCSLINEPLQAIIGMSSLRKSTLHLAESKALPVAKVTLIPLFITFVVQFYFHL